MAAAVTQNQSDTKKPVLVVYLHPSDIRLPGTSSELSEGTRGNTVIDSEMTSSSAINVAPVPMPYVSSGQFLEQEYWDMVDTEKDGNVFFMKQSNKVKNASSNIERTGAVSHRSNIRDFAERNRWHPNVICMGDESVDVPHQLRVRLILGEGLFGCLIL
jgi:hypothetical protein